MLVQVSYAIGVARPINIFVDTYGRSHVNMSDGEIARKIDELFDLRPKAIEDRLKLRNPIYQETAPTDTWAASRRPSSSISRAATKATRTLKWNSSPGRSWIMWTR